MRIRGTRQSGLSTLLREITADGEASGLEMLAVRGDLLAQMQPGRVFEELRAALGLHRRARDLGDSIDEVAQELSPASVICIDDVHLVDAISLRAMHSIRQRLGLRTVLTETVGRGRMEDLPPVWPETTIDLAPSDLTTTGALMREVLGGPIAPGAVPRVYGKSGGVAGITIAIVESARERGLLQFKDGLWRVHGPSLWSQDLKPYLDSLLAECSPGVGALVRYLSWNGPQPIEPLSETFSEEVLEEGVRCGVAVPVRGSARPSLQAWPPIYVERFRRAPEHVLQSPSQREDVETLPGALSTGRLDNELATMARTFSDHAKEVLSPLYEAWTETREPAEGVRYLHEALGIGSEAGRVERVMTETRVVLRSPNAEEIGFFLQLVAWNLVEQKDDAAAREHLDTLAMFSPQLAGSAEAIWVLFGALGGDGAPPADYRKEQDPLGFSVAARAAGAVMRGRVSAATIALEELTAFPSLRYLYVYLKAVVDLLAGKPDDALAFIARERAVAASTFDRPTFATLSYCAAVINYYLGDSRAAGAAIEEGLIVGRPRLTMSPIYAAMLNLEAMTAHYRGRKTLRDDLIQSAAQLSAAPGPFIGSGLDVIEIMISAERSGANDRMERAHALSRAIHTRIQKGYVIGAVQIALAILTLEYSPEAAQAFMEAEALAEETIYRRPARLVAALVSQDLEQVTGVLSEAAESHDRDLLFRLVAAAARHAELEEGEAFAKALFAQVASTQPPTLPANHLAHESPLSKRETEIARLAATMSNPEIAARLGLSRRTVENHVANALRKTSLRNRQDLAQFAERG